MDNLMFSLFLADILQAIGAVMDIKWIQEGKVEAGGFCDAQGIIQHVGETGVAMTTLAIAVYTFLGVWVGKTIRSIPITRAVLALIWGFLALIVIVGNTVNTEPRFETPTPVSAIPFHLLLPPDTELTPVISRPQYWCWISSHYLLWRIFAEYIWFWITLAFSILVYIPLYFWVRGNIVIHDPAWWRFHFQHADKSDPELRRRRRQSLVMAAYPLVYCVSILPLSVARWIGFVQEGRGDRKNHVPPAATFLAVAIYNLSGFGNVILLLTTKPDAELFGRPTNFASGRAPSPLLPSDASALSATVRRSEGLDAQSSSIEPRKKSKHEEEGEELGRLPSRSSGWDSGRG
ncbi:hypothetical protein NLJ89_g633 [Agrocybe chaxingu]|uniref:Glucose receptor Git3 N-terminal domain-containing protein n=1 Tax=Agrocybe chaxingu TaxID=84603 RepID=A0A9W8N1J8_9AGAR|nr:hypothetical protein NLJ89_g633 [Agrocybe chaxingu]